MKTRRTQANKPSLPSSTTTSDGQKENFQPKKREFKKTVSQAEGNVLFDAPSTPMEPIQDFQVSYISATTTEEAQLLKMNLSSSFDNLNCFLPTNLANAIQEKEENSRSSADNRKTEAHEQQSAQHRPNEPNDGITVIQEPPTGAQQQPDASDDVAELLRLSDEEFQQRKAMLIEHFRTGMQYYTQKWDALVQREQEVVQQTVDYVQHLKKNHRSISHGSYEE